MFIPKRTRIAWAIAALATRRKKKPTRMRRKKKRYQPKRERCQKTGTLS